MYKQKKKAHANLTPVALRLWSSLLLLVVVVVVALLVAVALLVVVASCLGAVFSCTVA